MGLNNMVVLKVSFLLLFLLGVTTARLDLSYITDQELNGDSKSTPCCDRCACTKSIPPQCHCADVRLNSCHSACEDCACTRSIPAMCRCHDTRDFCYEPCRSSEDH